MARVLSIAKQPARTVPQGLLEEIAYLQRAVDRANAKRYELVLKLKQSLEHGAVIEDGELDFNSELSRVYRKANS